MRTGKRWAVRLAAAVFLVCAAGLLWLLGAETVPHGARSEWLAPQIPMEELIAAAGPLELNYVLPEHTGALRPLLQIGSLSEPAELLLDGAPFHRITEGTGTAYLPLPAGSAGRTLTLKTERKPGDIIPSLFLTDDGIIREQVRADTSLITFPAAAYGVIFLLTLGLFLYGLPEGTRSWPALLLSAAALSQMAHFYFRNLSMFSLPPALYGLVLWQTRAFLYAAPPLCLLLRMKKRRKVFAPFAVIPALVYWVTAGFQTVIPVFYNVPVWIGIVYVPAIAALLICAVLEYRDGNPVFRHILTWLGGCTAAGVIVCIVSLMRTGALPPTLGMYLRDPLVWTDAELFCWNSLLYVLCFLESVTAQIRRIAKRETELRVRSAREALIREQLTTVEESAAALRALRHEVKSHYLVLQNLNCAGETERLGAYLSELVSEVAMIPSMMYAKHPAINAVLTTILARAQKQGIETECRAEVPETLPFPDTELCTVLMNLLQNALDANAGAPEGARKWIRVNLHIRGVHLYMGVENARFGPVDYDEGSGLCRTTKGDQSVHGYGLKAVQGVARKYRSELLLKFPDGSFSAATALQMPD